MFKSGICALLSLLVPAIVSAAGGDAAAPSTRILTGSDRGTYIQIGRDLSRFVAKPAGIRLQVLPSNGSADNIRRLRSQAGVGLALVQSDVYQAFMNEAAAGSPDALHLVKPLRVVMPLYEEELYFVVRADSPLNHVHEIRDKRINVGPIGSGTALSATTIYRAMFGNPIPDRNASFLGNEEALLRLATDRSIDVVVVVAGQPAKLFAEMKPEARQYIKLLRLDDRAAESRSALQSYDPGTIRSGSYPNWLSQDVPTLSTKALLVTYDFKPGGTQQALKRLAQSLCRNVNVLRAEGHAKWQEVGFELPALGNGWSYYGPTERDLRACEPAAVVASSRDGVARPDAAAACPQDRRVLGLCRR